MRLRFFAFLFLAGCLPASTLTPSSQADAKDGAGITGTSRDKPLPKPPRLVVAIVIDQFPSWAFKKYLPHLDKAGLMRRMQARGSIYSQVRYPYASTFTAPGHAALFTGRPPIESGIISNKLYDRANGMGKTSVQDSRYPVFGSQTKSAAPTQLKVPTVGDRWRRKTKGKAKVFSISFKDRAAVIPGGKGANLAIWYDGAQGSFTTSKYYAEKLPTWLAHYQQKRPIKQLIHPWQVADKKLCRKATGQPDDAPGEADLDGFGVQFPHDPAATSKPFKRLVFTPQLTEYMLELAEFGVDELELGRDDLSDLLCISISGSDYVGHIFGADSWEYFENLRRVDLALGALVARLEKKFGQIALLISSDHGVQKLPEQAGQGRLYADMLLARARAAARASVGEGNWVADFSKPFLFLTAEGMLRRDKLVPAIVRTWQSIEGVERAIDPRATRGWRNSKDPIERSIGLAFDPEVAAEVYLLPKRGWLLDDYRSAGGGTNHGTPWHYDSDVPLMFWHVGSQPSRHDRVVSQLRIAPTLARLLGFEMVAGTEASLIRAGSASKASRP